MLMFWNRREIYSCHSLQEFNKFKDKLSVANINYDYKIVNRNVASAFDSSRSIVGSSIENQNIAYQYYLYVHKNDYDEAIFVISKKIL